MHFFSDSLHRLNRQAFITFFQYASAAFALSAAQIGGQYAPWTLGLLSAAGAGLPGLGALTGTVLGALCFFDFQPGLRFTAAALLIFCACCSFSDTDAYRRPLPRALGAAGLFLAVQFVYLYGRSFSVWLLGLAAAVSAGISSLLLRQLIRRAAPPPCKPAAQSPPPESIRRSAAAFQSLYDGLFSAPATAAPENPAVIFDQAAQKVCRSCTLRHHCWQQEYNTTYNAFNDACQTMLKKREATADDFPDYFTAHCTRFPALLAAINQELRTYLLRRQYRLRLQNTRLLAASQYAQMGEILSSVRPAISPSDPVFSYRCASALRPKAGEMLCGDQLSDFTVGDTAYFLLSDGMGSGDAAHAESALTVRLLRQFLEAGITAEASLRTLNGALTLRNQECGAFTTIDLAAVDRRSGQISLYKFGAAASYVKRRGSVRRITGAALPAGLSAAEHIRPVRQWHMEEGSWLILCSDGVAGTQGDEWLMDLLAGFEGDDAELLCSLIMTRSRQQGGLQDDCAMMVLYMENSPASGEKQV